MLLTHNPHCSSRPVPAHRYLQHSVLPSPRCVTRRRVVHVATASATAAETPPTAEAKLRTDEATTSSSSSPSSSYSHEFEKAVDVVWPSSSTDAAVRVRRGTALMLLQESKRTALAGALSRVVRQLGTAEDLGIPKYALVLDSDPAGCFIRDERNLRLDAAALVAYADRVSTQPHRQQLEEAVRRAWPCSNKEGLLKRFAAGQLLDAPGYTAAVSALECNFDVPLYSMSLDIYFLGKPQPLLLEDSSGAFLEVEDAVTPQLWLDVPALLRAAGMDGSDSSIAADGSSSGSSSSSSGGGSSGSSGTAAAGSSSGSGSSSNTSSSYSREFEQALDVVWPSSSTDAAVQVARVTAQLLLQEQTFTSCVSTALSSVAEQLGSDTDLDVSGFCKLLDADPSGCFVRRGEQTLRLDAAALLRYAGQATQQQQQQQEEEEEEQQQQHQQEEEQQQQPDSAPSALQQKEEEQQQPDSAPSALQQQLEAASTKAAAVNSGDSSDSSSSSNGGSSTALQRPRLFDMPASQQAQDKQEAQQQGASAGAAANAVAGSTAAVAGSSSGDSKPAAADSSSGDSEVGADSAAAAGDSEVGADSAAAAGDSSSSGSNSSGTRSRSSDNGLRQLLDAAIDAVWPSSSTDGAVRVRRATALMLLQTPNHTTSSGALSLVTQQLGTARELGIPKYVKVLDSDPAGCFIRDERNLRLDAAALVAYAARVSTQQRKQQQRQQQQQPLQPLQQHSDRDVPAHTTQQQLEDAVRRAWPGSSPEACLKFWVAKQLLGKPGYTTALSAVACKLGEQFGSLAELGIFKRLKPLLVEDASRVFEVIGSGSSPTLRLDATALLRFTGMDSSDSSSSSSSSTAGAGSSSSGGGGDSDSSSSSDTAAAAGSSSGSGISTNGIKQLQLKSAAYVAWCGISPEARIKRCLGEYLVEQRGRKATVDSAARHLLQTLGGGLSALGVQGTTFKALLCQDASGAFTTRGSGTHEKLLLDTSALLRYVKQPPLPQPPQQPLQPQQQQQPLQPLQQHSDRDASARATAALLQDAQQAAAAAKAAKAAAADTQQPSALPPISQLTFELQLQDGNGWVQPTYVLHSDHQQQQQAGQRRRLFAASGLQEAQAQQQGVSAGAVGAAGVSSRLVGVKGVKAVLKPLVVADSSSSSSSSSSGSRASSGDSQLDQDMLSAAAGSEQQQQLESEQQQQDEEQQEDAATAAAGEAANGSDAALSVSDFLSSYDSGFVPEGADEAVWSISKLLPEMVHSDLLPYLPQDASPALEEVILDKNKPVLLRLSDRSTRILPYGVNLVEALTLLETAQKDWQMQGRIASVEDDGEGDVSPLASQQYLPDISYASQSAACRHAKDFSGLFEQDGRAGVPGTLHRISVLRNRSGTPIGLTYRLGRHVPDVARLLADTLSSMKASIMPGTPAERAQSLLVLGKPGTGKTTLLRDIARIMSTPPEQGGLGLAVLIVDTSNEIAGDADECHPCIGYARRLMVPSRDQQAEILVQAVQNHTPDVIIVDEIGTRQEVAAARTIAERGVVLIGTAHGNNLSNMLRNPELRPLVGGVNAVTLGDEMARKLNLANKTRVERAGAATFVSLLELQSRHTWRLHLDVEQSVDLLLSSQELAEAFDPYSRLTSAATAAATATTAAAGPSAASGDARVNTQVRSKGADGRLWVQFETGAAAEQTLAAAKLVAQLAGSRRDQ